MTKKFDYGVYGLINKTTGKLISAGSKEDCDVFVARERAIKAIRSSYYEIINVIKTYIDMKEQYYNLVALWILGTYMHKEFSSYPYLFFNAMRGSGKSRTLHLVTLLSKDGQVMASPTEAVLFRTKGTLGIDEFERVASKDKACIRELLNASYKKGIKILRMKKKKIKDEEQQVTEEFEPYRPVVMANIWGMDEVLGDRCLSIILEKSDDLSKILLTEDFEENNYINKIKKSLCECSLCSVVMKKNIYHLWNNYVSDRYKTTLTTYNTQHTQTPLTTAEKILLDTLFNKIHDSGIKGRNLELFMPLFLIADIVEDSVLDEIIKTAKQMTDEKTHEEEIESKDVMVYDFVANRIEGNDFYSVKKLTLEFRQFIDESADYLNSKWFGRALKRLDLVIDKRRTSIGVEVTLNIKKAEKKFKMFKK